MTHWSYCSSKTGNTARFGQVQMEAVFELTIKPTVAAAARSGGIESDLNRAGTRREHPVLVITGINRHAEGDLSEIAEALDPSPFLLRRRQRRQEQTRQNGDDDDHHQQFDKCEAKARSADNPARTQRFLHESLTASKFSRPSVLWPGYHVAP